MSTATQTPLREATQNAGAALADAEQGAQNQLAVRPYPGGATVALVPNSLEDAAKFAQLIARSDMVPKDYRQKPENCLVAIMMGADLGLTPMQAVQNISNINGRPAVWGDALLAVVIGHPSYENHEEYFEVDGKPYEGDPTKEQLEKPTTRAVAKFWRKGRRQPFIATFSWSQAVLAGLTTKRDTPWQTYPQRMVKMRARAFAARDAFPDALRGINFAEEAITIPGEVVASETVEMPQRASAQNGSTSQAEPTTTVEKANGTATAKPAPTVQTGATNATPLTKEEILRRIALADGQDRIVKYQKHAKSNGDPWWEFWTERGGAPEEANAKRFYTYSTNLGPQIEEATEASTKARVAFSEKNYDRAIELANKAIVRLDVAANAWKDKQNVERFNLKGLTWDGPTPQTNGGKS